VSWYELDALNKEAAAAFDSLGRKTCDLLNEEDILMLAEMLKPNTSAAFVVFEHVGATRLRDVREQCVASRGTALRVIRVGRIPPGKPKSNQDNSQGKTFPAPKI
jgi:hypothetical protein